jgi:hypothetical protein
VFIRNHCRYYKYCMGPDLFVQAGSRSSKCSNELNFLLC